VENNLWLIFVLFLNFLQLLKPFGLKLNVGVIELVPFTLLNIPDFNLLSLLQNSFLNCLLVYFRGH